MTPTRAGAEEDVKHIGKINQQVSIKHCVPFTDCISKIKNTQLDYVRDLEESYVRESLIQRMMK